MEWKRVLRSWQKLRGLFSQIFEKPPFGVFTQGLLIREVMMISEPVSSLLAKVLQFHYEKKTHFAPVYAHYFTQQDTPFVSGLMVWNNTL